MDQRVKKYLEDVYVAASIINDFISNCGGFEEFESDIKTKSAVERQLEILCESYRKYQLSDNTPSLENIDEILKLRKRMQTVYDDIDASMIWAVLKKNIANLKAESKAIIKNDQP